MENNTGMIQDDIEIMAPAGSHEAVSAALQAGADAIYFGVGNLNMRSRSTVNFTLEEMAQITERCQRHGTKCYLTVNTIVYPEELDEVELLLQSAKTCGITAVIASDWAVITRAAAIGLPVHVSTQCNITNLEAVRFYAKYAEVMVTARELNLKQVAEIAEGIRREHITGPDGRLVRLELFAHGALCMAVSGKCYLSLDNLGPSANRGACLQPCRRRYEVRDADNELDLLVSGKYILSPKDLCTIGFLDKILDAGVSVLKIEGRGRSPEYVKTVTECYKEAVQACRDGSYGESKVKAWTERLGNVYNRGFWDGYYLGRRMGEWTERYGSQARKTKIHIGTVTNYFSRIGVAEVRVENDRLQKGDELLIIGPTTGVAEACLDEIRVELQPVEKAEKGTLCSIPVHGKVRRNDKVYRLIPACDSEDY